jgi:hypothetical protein
VFNLDFPQLLYVISSSDLLIRTFWVILNFIQIHLTTNLNYRIKLNSKISLRQCIFITSWLNKWIENWNITNLKLWQLNTKLLIQTSRVQNQKCWVHNKIRPQIINNQNGTIPEIKLQLAGNIIPFASLDVIKGWE